MALVSRRWPVTLYIHQPGPQAEQILNDLVRVLGAERRDTEDGRVLLYVAAPGPKLAGVRVRRALAQAQFAWSGHVQLPDPS